MTIDNDRIIAHDRALGDKPWIVVAPAASHTVLPPHIPDSAIDDAGFWWWVEGTVGNWHVMYSGGDGGPQEAHNTEYPDKIWDYLLELDPSLKK